MKIEFVEEIDLALRRIPEGRVTKSRRFKVGEVHEAEFLGEDSDLETIDIQLADGLFALKVPRSTVSVRMIQKAESPKEKRVNCAKNFKP